VGVPSPDGEQEVKIFLVLKPEESVDLTTMGAWLGEQMPKFMTPRYLEVIEEFPKTPATGRTQKSILRAQAAGPNEWDQQKSRT
jgi:crotonobetaine/carnitine-CoA ligase